VKVRGRALEDATSPSRSRERWWSLERTWGLAVCRPCVIPTNRNDADRRVAFSLVGQRRLTMTRNAKVKTLSVTSAASQLYLAARSSLSWRTSSHPTVDQDHLHTLPAQNDDR
jgi:hypothetical protein